MTRPDQHVILVRTPTGPADPYNLPLSSLLGQPPTQLGLLTTTFPSTNHLAALLTAPPSYQSVVITSARSIQALQAAIDHLASSSASPHPGWATLNWFVVGRPTKEALCQLNTTPDLPTDRWKIDRSFIFGHESGCADNLGPLIVRHLTATSHHSTPSPPPAEVLSAPQTPIIPSPTAARPPARLLYLTGDKNRDTLDAHLAAGSGLSGCLVLDVDRLRVYETAVAADFPARFEAALAPLLPPPNTASSDLTITRRLLWIVLFSPSGAAAVLPELRSRGLLPRARALQPGGEARGGEALHSTGLEVRLVAIGPTTRSFLDGEEGVTCAAMAATPDPEGVREAIRLAAAGNSTGGIERSSRGGCS